MYLHRLFKFGNLDTNKAPWVEDAKAAYDWCLHHLRVLVDDNLEAVMEEFRQQLGILNELLKLDRKSDFPELDRVRKAYTHLHVLSGKGKVNKALEAAKKQVTSKDKVTAAAEVKAAPLDKNNEPKKAADRKPDPAVTKKTTAPTTAAATEPKNTEPVAGVQEQKTTAAPASTPRQPQKSETEQRNAAVVKQQVPSAPRPSPTTATTTTPTPPKTESQPAIKSSPTSFSPDNSAIFAPFGVPVITTVFSCPPIPGEDARPSPVDKKRDCTDTPMQTEHTNPNAQHKDKPKDKSALEVVKSLSSREARLLLMQLDVLELRGDVTIDELRRSLKTDLGEEEAVSAEGSDSRVEKKTTASHAQTAPKITAASVPSATPVTRTAPRSTGTAVVTAAAATNTVATTATTTTAAPRTTTVRKVDSVRKNTAASKSDEARKRTVAAEKKTIVKKAAPVKAIQQAPVNDSDNESRKRKRSSKETSQAPGSRRRHCTTHAVDGSDDEYPQFPEGQKWKKPALPASTQDSCKRRRPEPESESEEEDLSDLGEEPFKKRRTHNYAPHGFSQRPGPTQPSRESGSRFTLTEDNPSPLEMGGILDMIRRPNRQPPDLVQELAEKDRIDAMAEADRKEEQRRRRE